MSKKTATIARFPQEVQAKILYCFCIISSSPATAIPRVDIVIKILSKEKVQKLKDDLPPLLHTPQRLLWTSPSSVVQELLRPGNDATPASSRVGCWGNFCDQLRLGIIALEGLKRSGVLWSLWLEFLGPHWGKYLIN